MRISVNPKQAAIIQQLIADAIISERANDKASKKTELISKKEFELEELYRKLMEVR